MNCFKFIILDILVFMITSIVGDVQIDPSATHYKDSVIAISFYVTDNDITFLVNFTQFGYFAILYQNTMTNGDYTIVQINTSSISPDPKKLIMVSDGYGGKGHVRPYIDIKNDIKLLGYDTDSVNFLTVKYNRLLNTNDTQDTILYRNQQFNFSYAYRSGSKTLTRHNKTQRNYFSGILNNNYQMDYGYTTPVFRHGILLTISWCLLADIAIFIKFFTSFKYNIITHGLIFLIIFFITAEQLITVNNFLMPSISNLDTVATSHYIISMLFICIVLLQILLGLVSKLLENGEQISPEIIGVIRLIHRISGYVIILISKINCIIGWILFGRDIATIIISIEIFLIIILFLIFRLYFVKKLEHNLVVQKVISPMNYWIDIDLILEEPYNSPKLDTLKFVIFNNQIYIIPQNFGHPGGAKIIKLINHREIDKYMYGLKALQIYPFHTKYSHPLSSLSTLGLPIFTIPANPLYNIPSNQEYTVSVYQPITQQMRIYYLKPVFGRIKFEMQYNLIHIGQYFILNGYNQTRIYPCTICFRHSNILKMEKMLEKKQINILQSDRIIDFNQNLELGTGRQILNVPIQQSSKFTDMDKQIIKSDELIPIVIKKSTDSFQNDIFNSKDFETLRFKVQGLKGKGFNINLLPQGHIFLICDGDGILPFLDLLDILFKIILAENKKIVDEQFLKQIQIYNHILEKYKFFLICQFHEKNDLVYVDQLIYMAKSRSDIFKMRLKFFFKNSVFGSDNNQFEKLDQFQTKQNLEQQILEKQLIPHKNKISMIFLSGRAVFCKGMYESLKKKGIEQKHMYFV